MAEVAETGLDLARHLRLLADGLERGTIRACGIAYVDGHNGTQSGYRVHISTTGDATLALGTVAVLHAEMLAIARAAYLPATNGPKGVDHE